ncbi:MAG: glycosyltransferase family 4 protein [Gammaproteobacteria bacterium]
MIIITTQCFPPRIGGIEGLIYGLCMALSERGHEVTVFADGDNSHNETSFDRAQSFAIRRHAGLKPLRRRKKARNIGQWLRRHKADGIIADSWKSLEHLPPGLSPLRLCLAHGMEIPEHTSRPKGRRIQASLDKATAIIANSRFTANRVRRYIQDPERLHIINPGIMPPQRPDLLQAERIKIRLNGRTPVLITVARLERRKGHHKVLSLLPQFIKNYPALLYVIIGDGPEYTALQGLTTKLGLEQHVLFAGVVGEQERNAYLEQSDLFLMPGSMEKNDVEGFGIAYMEAACFGVPAIAGHSGGAAEAVLDKETGLICRAGDDTALAAGLARLLADEDLRHRLGNNARERVHALLWPNIIKDYERLLDI